MLRVILVSGCFLAFTCGATAQQFFPIEQGMTPGRFIDPPRSILQQLRTAEESSADGRHGDAVVVLGELLQRDRTFSDDELTGQDFFLDAGLGNGIQPPPRLSKTLIGEASRLLSSLRSEAIVTYELRYGADARKLLDEASTKRNWNAVAEVKRRFFHTEAGRDATQLLISSAISQGSALQASRLINSLLTHPKLDAKSKTLAEELLRSLNELPSESIALRARRNEASPDFLMFAGQQSLPENAGGQLPLADPLYTVDTTGSSRQERTLVEAVESMTAMGELPPPSWLPLRIGNHLLMRTTERLVGVDFVTGKRVWEYPWFKTEQDVEKTELEIDGMRNEDSGQSLLKQRVWNDLLYGRISSDGVRVYMLGDLAQIEVATFSPLMGMQGTRPADTGKNSLIALDLATEGKLVWQIGGDVPSDESLADAFFLGPPLPIDNSLYVMAEIAGDIILLCLDASTGVEIWRQHLLAFESGGIESDPIRRIAGATISHQDGVLVCVTGAGAVVAIDLHDRSLLWGAAIDRNDTIQQSVSGRRDGSQPSQTLKRWWDSTPMIVGNTVYVTPIESDRFYAFDLLTGEKRWPEFARTQKNARYFAGVHEGVIILVGNDNVHAVDVASPLKSTSRTWKTKVGWLDSGEQISGLGMFGRVKHPATGELVSTYFVPTSFNRVIAVSLVDGSSLAHRTTSFPLGNLIAIDGQIISQAVTLLSVAYGQESLEPKVIAALEADPTNVEMMTRMAQLLMEQNQRGDALKWLEKARVCDPANDEVRQLSISAMLGALREDFASNENLLTTLDPLIDQPKQRAELIKLQVISALDRNQPAEAIKRLIELSSRIASDQSLESEKRSSDEESSRYVSLDSWICARVAEAVELTESEQRQQISTVISTHLDKHLNAPTPSLQRLAHQFGSLPGSKKMILQLLERYREDKQWLAMERLVLASASATPDNLERLAPWQALALASVYAAGGLKPDAAAALQAAMQNEPEAKLAATELREDLQQLARMSAGGTYAESWDGPVTVRQSGEAIAGRIGMQRKISVGENKRVTGLSFEGWQLTSDESSPVALRDPFGIPHTIPVEGINRLDEQKRQAMFSGGLMIALLRGELIAVNLFDLRDGQADPVLWRRAWQAEGSGGSGFRRRSDITDFGDHTFSYIASTGGTGSQSGELQLGPIVGDTFYLLQGKELIALDAVTRRERWRNMEGPQGGTIVCDGEVVAIVSPNSQLIVKYDCRDGRRLSETPFTDYKVWASTNDAVLLYRDLGNGKRELVLQNPINGETLLEHVFEGLGDDVRVLGRIVESAYMVALSTTGETLIWDLEKRRVVSDAKVDPIPSLSGLHVLARHDSLVLLPAVSDSDENAVAAAFSAGASDDHVRVDVAAWAVNLSDGTTAWKVPIEKEPWRCTLTQSSVSPLVLMSRAKSNYLTTGSRTKLLDVMAIDTRDAKTYVSTDLDCQGFNNDIDTRLTVQPPQQRVNVNINSLRLEYQFGTPTVSDRE